MPRKKKENYALDTEKTLDSVLGALNDRLKLESTYFELMLKVSNNADDLTILTSGSNQFKMSMADQIRFLEIISATQTLANELVEKYGFEKSEEEDL